MNNIRNLRHISQIIPNGAVSGQLHEMQIDTSTTTLYPNAQIADVMDVTFGFNLLMDADRSIEGINVQGGALVLFLANYTDYTLTLLHDSASNPENSFRLPANMDFQILQNTIVSIVYDDLLERWLIVG